MPTEPAVAPGRAPKRSRADLQGAIDQQQQGARDLSREALAVAAAPIDNSYFAQLAAQAGIPGFPQPAAAAAAPPAPDTSHAQIMAALSSLNDRLDQQAADRVVAPSVPASVTTSAAQQVGKAVVTLSQNMKESATGAVVQPVRGILPAAQALATPASATPVMPFPGAPLGISDSVAGGQDALQPLVNAADWEALGSAGLLGLMLACPPPVGLATVLQYTGRDLFAAQPLPDAVLAKEYSRPSVDFVAGRGFANQQFWQELAGSNLELQRWVKDGYSEFVKGEVPRVIRANNPNTADHVDFVTKAVGDLVSVGAVEVVTHLRSNPWEVSSICPLTVAVQGSGKLRLCWNGRPVNVSMPVQKFKLEHIQVALGLVQPGDMLFTIDMQAGYHQVPVKPWMRKLLCFEWAGQVYRWQVLPFGLSTAPRAYSKLGRALLKRWRGMGIRCSNYIDDFFFAAKPVDIVGVRQRVLADLTQAGWYISAAKCMLEPGTMVKYLGFEVCSLPVPHVRVPAPKIAKLRESFRGILRRAQLLPAAGVAADVGSEDCEAIGSGVRVRGRTLARLLGFLQSCRVAIPIVAVATKALQGCVTALPHGQQGWLDYGSFAELSEAALLECQFWYHRVSLWNGAVLKPGSVSRVHRCLGPGLRGCAAQGGW